MLFRSYKPAAPLCEFVEDFWLYQNYAGEHARERILPSGTFEMVFNLNEVPDHSRATQRKRHRSWGSISSRVALFRCSELRPESSPTCMWTWQPFGAGPLPS